MHFAAFSLQEPFTGGAQIGDSASCVVRKAPPFFKSCFVPMMFMKLFLDRVADFDYMY